MDSVREATSMTDKISKATQEVALHVSDSTTMARSKGSSLDLKDLSSRIEKQKRLVDAQLTR